METLLAFVGATAAGLAAFELAGSSLGRPIRGRLLSVADLTAAAPAEQASFNTWQAILAGVWPSRFHPQQARNREDVIDRLRRAGYPWPTTGAFYAYAVRAFGLYVAIGLALAGAAVMSGGDILIAVLIFLSMAINGLRRPYTRLKRLTRERAEAMRLNMLPVLSALHAYLRAGVGVQEALREVRHVGGPFANLLGFMVARMQVEPFDAAIEQVRKHLPDPNDPIVMRFMDAVEAYFMRNRPMLDTVAGLLDDLRDEHADQTAERVALTKRQAVLFGVLAVIGMLITIIWPALG